MAQLNLCFQVAFLAVLLPLTSGACVDFYLGMGSGTIPDSKINASSIQSASTPATNGRLNYTLGSSWCAGTSDKNPYLQIDLQKLHIICAVSTQGNSQADQWVKTYTLQLSTDGITWTNYSELGGQAKVLEGNKDRNSNVKHVLYGVLTRYLRFLPQTHHGEVCMRTEMFGVQQKPTCDSQAMGLASGGTIPDDSFSASSTFAPRYAAKYGRINGEKAWEPKTNTDPDDYLQIDLLYEYVICAVATQGNPPKQSTAQEWTTEYKLRFSFNGTTFFPYKENKNDKAFQGNSGKTDTVKNSLKEFASAKYIRFLPTKYNRFKALRVEAYGILFTKVPSQPPTAFKLTATSSTSIAASWQLPPVHARHATITGFKLFYTEKGSGVSITTVTISGESTFSRNVTGLDKYTEYEFQVLAFSSDGDGPKSSVEVERTMEDAPSKAPSNFKVSAVTSTIITASWQLPPADSRNGIIIGFKLFYKKRGSSGQATTLTINNGTALSKDVTGLDIYTEYEFEVLAFTSVGGGPKSSPLVVVRTMKDGCVEFNLGMEDGRILDTGINASSSSTPAKNGRLNYVSGSSWCARTGDSNPYLQIDLQTLHIICAVSTQGNSRADQWVKTYTLQLSIDGTTWTNYTELGGQAKVLIGNDDKNSEVKHVVYGVLTRYLRFRPETHQGGVCMRTEVFGVKQKPTCDSQAIGLASSGRIPDNSFSARSIFAPRYAAKYGRLNGEKAWEPKTNTDPDDYLQIDLLYEYVICAVATQGNPPSQSTAQEWTTEYKLRFSFSDNTFFPYEENKIDKAFPGNSGKTDTVKNSLKEFASAKFIRFLPTKYNKFKVLRVEAYGILFTKAPSVGPEPLSLSTVNKTTFNISWEPLPREKSHGKVILYEVKAIFVRKGNLRKRSVINSPSVNTSVTYVVLSDLELCAKYNVSVRAYTAEGPGPYGKPLELETSRPDAPGEFKVTDSGTNQITVAWKQYDEKETIVYAVKYTGTKSYNKTFRDAEKTIKAIKATTQKVEGLIPGTTYEFRVHGTSVCGDSASRVISEMTDMMAPEAPHPHNITDVEVSQTAVDIYLWPVEQKYGPVSAYQVIVLKVADGVKELPDNYDSKLKAVSDAKKENVNFYIATEIENEPILSKPQKFTVGDGNKFKEFVNEELEKGENYIVYERALTKAEKGELKGYASIVAKISITSTTTDKPHVNDLPERTITAVGELAVLTCDVSGDLEASVTWTKDGLTSIPRAQFKNSGKILIIQDVVPGDSGVYECKAMNLFGESRTSTVLIVAVPPRIMEELSPSEVICEKQTPCFLSCQASSYIPFNYSWTKDGQVPTSDNIKLMNNSIIVTPRDRQDYGGYVCHATNNLGSTEYTITLLSPKGIPRNIFLVSVIALSCAVVVLLIIICGLIWQRRRAVPSERIQGKEKVDFHGVKSSPDRQWNDEQASDPNTYMELKARLPNHKQSHVPTEYQSLQEVPMNPEYYNMVLQKEIGGKQNEEVYEEI